MSLKHKLWLSSNAQDGPWMDSEMAEKAEKIAEKYIIEFTEWVRTNAYDTGDKWLYQEDDETYTTKELLGIYKNLSVTLATK